MFGGYDGTKCYNDIEIFDTENKVWSQPKVEGNVPQARNAHSITVVRQNLILFGGHSGNKHLYDLHIFDTKTLTWTEPKFSSHSPNGLRGHTATHLGNKIVIFGGYDGKGRSNELFILNLEDFSWKHFNEIYGVPGPRQRHSAIAIDNKNILIFGGFDGLKWLDDLHLLDMYVLMESIIKKKSLDEYKLDMKNLVNNKNCSDITFTVEHNKTLYGHKCKPIGITVK